MNFFDSFKAARCDQQPMAVDMRPMASTYNPTLVRNTHFRSRGLAPHVARAMRWWVRNSNFCLLDLAGRNILLVGVPWLKHIRISWSESKYSGCYECVWLADDIHMNNMIIQFDNKRSFKWLRLVLDGSYYSHKFP